MDKIKEEKTSNKSKPLVLAFTAATESPIQQTSLLPNAISLTGDSKSKPTPIDTSAHTASKKHHSVGAKKAHHTPGKKIMSTPTSSAGAGRKRTPSAAAKKISTPK